MRSDHVIFFTGEYQHVMFKKGYSTNGNRYPFCQTIESLSPPFPFCNQLIELWHEVEMMIAIMNGTFSRLEGIEKIFRHVEFKETINLTAEQNTYLSSQTDW